MSQSEGEGKSSSSSSSRLPRFNFQGKGACYAWNMLGDRQELKLLPNQILDACVYAQKRQLMNLDPECILWLLRQLLFLGDCFKGAFPGSIPLQILFVENYPHCGQTTNGGFLRSAFHFK